MSSNIKKYKEDLRSLIKEINLEFDKHNTLTQQFISTGELLRQDREALMEDINTFSTSLISAVNSVEKFNAEALAFDQQVRLALREGFSIPTPTELKMWDLSKWDLCKKNVTDWLNKSTNLLNSISQDAFEGTESRYNPFLPNVNTGEEVVHIVKTYHVPLLDRDWGLAELELLVDDLIKEAHSFQSILQS